MPTQSEELTDAQLMRYSRHIMLPSMDIDGQIALWQARVLIIGIGGLGCAAAQYLAASGVGHLVLVDDDVVEDTNLQRQVLHTEQRVGALKTQSAKNALAQINSQITIDTIDSRLNEAQLTEQCQQASLVLDCTDNAATRSLINQVCWQTQTALVSGAAIRFEGQVSCFTMQANMPCYQCLAHLFDAPSLTCSQAGVLSPIVGVVGALQAVEAIKYIAKIGTGLNGKLLMIDGLSMDFQTMSLPVNPNCSVCQAVRK